VPVEAINMRQISLKVPEQYLRDLDLLVKERFYPTRAEAIRLAIRRHDSLGRSVSR